MRRPNRNIEIFSLSVLDLFSAAMGAFIMVSIVLLPYYFRTNLAKAQIGNLQGKLSQCMGKQADLRKQLSAARDAATQNAQAAEQLRTCLIESASTFIVVVMRWEKEGYDVDLHIVDAEGRTYYYGKKRYGDDSLDPQLSFDNTKGPGIEIWQDPRATPGAYCIAFHLFSSTYAQPSIQVDGRIFYRNNMADIPAVVLDKGNYYYKAASIDLTRDGKFSVHLGQWNCPEESAGHGPPGTGNKTASPESEFRLHPGH